MNYKERLSKLGILPLEYGKELADRLLFFKCQTGVVDLIRQDYLKHSFFNRVVCLWNKLPSEHKSIETLTLTLFKRKLCDFYTRKFELEYISPT